MRNIRKKLFFFIYFFSKHKMGTESSGSSTKKSYGAISKTDTEITKEIKDKPFGVQKVMLMNKFGQEKDKKMVIAG